VSLAFLSRLETVVISFETRSIAICRRSDSSRCGGAVA
jgi:hypothetical protein